MAEGFTLFASKRVILVVVLIAAVVWGFSFIPETSGRDESANASIEKAKKLPIHAAAQISPRTAPQEKLHSETDSHAPKPDVAPGKDDSHSDSSTNVNRHTSEGEQPSGSHATGKDDAPSKQASDTSKHKNGQGHAPTAAHTNLPTGVAFVNATIAPLSHELSGRLWGWRPNDLVNLTDNMNNFQLGVLEVTRRTVVPLAGRISRTGTTDAFNPNLENAMNWLMVKATRYWFPRPEDKYKESLRELEAYRDRLMNKRGSFYTRADNLIPLLSSYEDLLGSCDENLVKQKNDDGKKVSLFKADDYFYYAKGVAKSMATVLEAVHHDFHKTLESRNALELLHHALESCRQAAALEPLMVTNGDLDGIFANHRANMAAPISHARFFIGQLIKTLST